MPNLRVSSTGPVTLDQSNNIGTFASGTTNAVTVNNGTNSLTIGVVDGVTGIVTGNSAITITADNLNIAQPVNAGTGIVTLAPFSAGQVIALGGADAVGTLGLSDAELGNITASILRVGAVGNTGGITVAGAVTRHAGYGTLSMTTAGSITQAAALSVANLALRSGGGITLTNAGNDVDTLAFNNTAGSVAYTDTNALTIGSVDGLPADLSTNIKRYLRVGYGRKRSR